MTPPVSSAVCSVSSASSASTSRTCASSTRRARSSDSPRSASNRPRCTARSRGFRDVDGGLRGTPMTDTSLDRSAADTSAVDFIAIDGPAGSGKSSVSKAVARRLGFGYLDTGSAYRALAWHVLDRGADTADADAVLAAASDFPVRLGLDPDDRTVQVGDVDVTQAIRETRVSNAVSGVARVGEVREQVNRLFRSLVA